MQVELQKELTESLEHYIEAIYWIVNSKKAARPKHIVDRMNVGKSSVTGALQTLANKGLINYAPYDVITLTDEGLAVARSLVRRNEVIRDFFIRVLSVEPDDADIAACSLEHVISDTVLDRLIAFVEYVERCPQGNTSWIKGFGYHCDNDFCADECELCQEHKNALNPNKGVTQVTVDRPTLSQFGESDRLVLVDVDPQSPVYDWFKEIGAQLGAVIEIEKVNKAIGVMHVKVKGYHEQLAIDYTRAVWVHPIRKLNNELE